MSVIENTTLADISLTIGVSLAAVAIVLLMILLILLILLFLKYKSRKLKREIQFR